MSDLREPRRLGRPLTDEERETMYQRARERDTQDRKRWQKFQLWAVVVILAAITMLAVLELLDNLRPLGR